MHRLNLPFRLKPGVIASKYACYVIGHHWINTCPGRETA
jgi:hypothetical protein